MIKGTQNGDLVKVDLDDFGIVKAIVTDINDRGVRVEPLSGYFEGTQILLDPVKVIQNYHLI